MLRSFAPRRTLRPSLRSVGQFALACAGLLPGLSACAAPAPPAGAGVTLVQVADKVILDNGIVRATISPSDARCVSMIYAGHEMVSTSGRSHSVYFSSGGGDSYEQPSRCVFSITKQEPDVVDISCKRTFRPRDHSPWDIDVHYALRAGVSGLYSYVLLEHPAAYPAGGIGEWRTVWWMPQEKGEPLMERIYVDEARHWTMPANADFAHEEHTGIKEIVKLTTGPWAGKYDCKYAYAAEYESVGTYGHASDINKIGAWMVLGGYDYFNEGPLKQDLAPAAGIIHLHLQRNHYGATSWKINEGQDWQKMFGPWLLYCNSGQPADALWANAKAQVAKEKAQWPYKWVDNAEYAAAQRLNVTGKLTIHDALKPTVSAANAWVGLAQPEETAGNWQTQGSAYQYWTRADADGTFSIPAVRPGKYTLYAFNNGVVGEFKKDNIAVSAGQSAVGDLTWEVAHPGKTIAWEIGIPDRKADEFRHGSTDYFTPYLWNNFSQEFSNPIEYDVAKKNWATELNYAHNGYNVGGKRDPWKWRLHFNLDQLPADAATLTMAFAGANNTEVQVFVNDESAPFSTVKPPVNGGNALVRESNHAKYSVVYLKIPVANLRRGANIITLTTTPGSSDGNHVMYDYLNMELP